MKKYILIILAVALSASCKDLLNMAPSNQLATENMWMTEAQADAGMDGLYQHFYRSNSSSTSVAIGNGINRQGWMAMEFQSSSYNVYTVYLSEELIYPTKRATATCVSHEWQWCYTGIHKINDAIENLYKSLNDESMTQEKYERYMCEAKFLRAWHYSRLNKIFQGVPVYLEVVSNEECTKGPSTSTEVWEVVINDLNDCIDNPNFPNNTLSSLYGRPSKGAAYALRGMAYMWLAWENNESSSYYQLAAADFEKVAQCGYGLYEGNYIDFFNVDNERNKEMIFPLQFDSENGYGDILQEILGGIDAWGGSAYIRPAPDFVNYYQNADGSKFNWEDVIPEWNSSDFADVSKREVFFLRDSIYVENGQVLPNKDKNPDGPTWSEDEMTQLLGRLTEIGFDYYEKYYLPEGNEARIRQAYENRDPRLEQTVLTPYGMMDAFTGADTDGFQENKVLRWPLLSVTHEDYADYNMGGAAPRSTYGYRKYVYTHPSDLIAIYRCPTDWPLIRYTDVYLYLAECYVHTGNLSGAVSIVNEIRSRAGMPAISTGSTDEVMEAVRYERRVELCAEGVDYFDEWRWGTYKEMKFQGKNDYGACSWWGQYQDYAEYWYYTDNMFPWGAPSSECDRNSNIPRKEGWSY